MDIFIDDSPPDSYLIFCDADVSHARSCFRKGTSFQQVNILASDSRMAHLGCIQAFGPDRNLLAFCFPTDARGRPSPGISAVSHY